MTNPQPFVTRPLPTGRNMYGRPIWEPPILSYTSLIGEEYLQKRKAYLHYTNNDVAKTTSMMDVFTEYNLLGDYCRWTDSCARFARKEGDRETAGFWEEMNEELLVDFEEVREARMSLRVSQYRYPDGRWEIVGFERARRGGDVPWRDPIKPPVKSEWKEDVVSMDTQQASLGNENLQTENLDLEGVDDNLTEKKLPDRENEIPQSPEEAEYPPSHDLFTLWF